MQKLLHPLPAAFAMIGVGRTTGYALIKKGRLHLIKIGRKSLIADEEIRSLATELLAEAKAA